MALVTGNYVTSAGAPVPAGAQPRIEVVPSKGTITANGQAISAEPQTVTPNATTGAFSLNLIPTVDVADAGFHYLIRGYYLAPTAYGTSGHTRHDIFEHKIYVPAGGGTLGELSRLPMPVVTWVMVDPTWTTANPPQLIIPGFLYLSAHITDPNLGTGQLWKAVP